MEKFSLYRCEKETAGTNRTVVVTRSQSFLAKQLVGLAQTRGRVEVQLSELARLLSGHRHRMDAARLAARVDEALSPTPGILGPSCSRQVSKKSSLTIA